LPKYERRHGSCWSLSTLLLEDRQTLLDAIGTDSDEGHQLVPVDLNEVFVFGRQPLDRPDPQAPIYHRQIQASVFEAAQYGHSRAVQYVRCHMHGLKTPGTSNRARRSYRPSLQ
jgi:hypothetical protein